MSLITDNFALFFFHFKEEALLKIEETRTIRFIFLLNTEEEKYDLFESYYSLLFRLIMLFDGGKLLLLLKSVDVFAAFLKVGNDFCAHFLMLLYLR